MSSSNLIQSEVLLSKARGMLRALQAASDKVQATALVSHDGLTLASVLSPEVNADRFGAMCASLLALATRAAGEVDRGELRQVILDGSQGPLLLTRAGHAGVLAVAAAPSANLGKVILDTRKTAADLATLATTAG
ncbi:MAG: roadblock/LC7 domain-containing protein [Curvibacter sp.]